jgi:hypothetical protein
MLPKGDDAFRFAVGRKTVLFADDLDGGAPGWTHALIAGQDDWNLGDPQTLGTNAYDPLTPYSGSACWGNDLQVTSANQNGLYQSNAENVLRSPFVNASGKTGVRIRYRRWLTIESGQFDQATLSLNGQQVFANPSTGDLLDTSWTLQDHRAPAADGVASFQVEWRLKADGGVNRGGWTIDDVEIYALEATPVLSMGLASTPANPTIGTTFTFDLSGTPGASWTLYASTGPGPEALDGFGVVDVATAGAAVFLTGVMPAGGAESIPIGLPFLPQLVGVHLYWQGTVDAPGALTQISNGIEQVFQ